MTKATAEGRDHTRTLLPFRAEIASGPAPVVSLLYEAHTRLPDGHVSVIPYRFLVGDVTADPHQAVVNPLGAAIYRLMKMYWSLEGTLLPAQKEKEQLEAANAELRAEVNSLRGRVQYLERLVPDEALKKRKA